MNVDNIRLAFVHTVGFLVEGCTGHSIDGRGRHLILFSLLFQEAAVIVIFQSFLDNGPFFSNGFPRLIRNLRESRQLLVVSG